MCAIVSTGYCVSLKNACVVLSWLGYDIGASFCTSMTFTIATDVVDTILPWAASSTFSKGAVTIMIADWESSWTVSWFLSDIVDFATSWMVFKTGAGSTFMAKFVNASLSAFLERHAITNVFTTRCQSIRSSAE